MVSPGCPASCGAAGLSGSCRAWRLRSSLRRFRSARWRFFHQKVAWFNDAARAAFAAQGHAVIDQEQMLGVRVDANPASFDGRDRDTLHFCMPGPSDWAMDVVIRRIAEDG